MYLIECELKRQGSDNIYNLIPLMFKIYIIYVLMEL